MEPAPAVMAQSCRDRGSAFTPRGQKPCWTLGSMQMQTVLSMPGQSILTSKKAISQNACHMVKDTEGTA